MNLFVLWPICSSSSLVHFKNGPENNTRGEQLRFVSHWRDFCYVVRFRVVFSFSWGVGFLFFFFHPRMSGRVRFQYSQLFVSFFSERSYFSWFGSSISSVLCICPLFIFSIAHFSLSNSILPACLRVSNSFSFSANNLMPTMYMRCLIFSRDLWSLYLPVHFQSMWLLQIVMMIAHLSRRSLYGFSPLLSFFLLMSVRHSSFAWYFWQVL